MNKKEIIILGSGGFALEAISFIEEMASFHIAGIVSNELNEALPYPHLGEDDILHSVYSEKKVKYAFVAVGNPEIRKKLSQVVEAIGFEVPSIIHPKSYIFSHSYIGKGSIVYPHATINAGARVGHYCLINSNVSIGHQTIIEDFVNINPGANLAGNVHVGEQSFLGIGCNVLEKIKIQRKTIVGGGALVNKNTSDNSKVVGVPARSLP